MVILKNFLSCKLCGGPSEVLLIDSPVGSLCKKCYEEWEDVAVNDSGKAVGYKIEIRELINREKLLS